ncbi:MAG TPA: hypothetical protein VGB85_04125 [Nannocystis sp.]
MKSIWYLEVIWNFTGMPTPPTSSQPQPCDGAPGRMARFILRDGTTLEIHVPDATTVETGDSRARTAGFILRYGREIVDVGLLARLIRRQGPRAQ